MDDRARLSLEIDEATDRETLERLRAVAEAHPDPRVKAMRIKVGAKLFKLREVASRPEINLRSAAAAEVSEVESSNPGAVFALPAPTGEPLYRYRLGDEAFAQLQRQVSQAIRGGLIEQGSSPARFVLWAAEWFRRCYRGQGHEWDTLLEALDGRVDHGILRQITERGMAWWRRKLRTNLRGRFFLGSLAREGGFPIAAIEQGGRGWARDALAAIVAPLMANPAAGQEEAEAFALAQRERIPAKLYQDEEFALLCADLALAVATVRRDAEPAAAAAGLPITAWLAAHRPNWRGALPLTMSGAGAEALLGELLQVEAGEAIGIGGSVERLLVRDVKGSWREAARIGFDGSIDKTVMTGIDPAQGRLRAFAAGDFARTVPGELGMIEPPGEGETVWHARSTKRARGSLDVPLAAAIELDLRSGEQQVGRVMLRGGKPRRGRLLVCTILEDGEDAPRLLKVVASGSTMLTAEIVVIQAPTDWTVTTLSSGEVTTSLGPGIGQTLLWRVAGGALVTDAAGDAYRIRTGQTRDRRDRLEFDGKCPRWAGLNGDVELYNGPPNYWTSDASRGAVFIRAIGAERSWRPAPKSLPIGHYDVGWREGNLLLDRRRIAVLPSQATLACSGRGRDAQYRPTGWDGVTITPSADAPVRINGDAWRARPMSSATYWFDAQIAWPDAPSLAVRIRFPSEAAIARWDGAVLPPNARITLADLNDLVAVDEGPMRLFGELVERGGRGEPAVMTWAFEREMPMSAIAADLSSLLLPASNDAKVRLGMLDGVETYWDVRPFPLLLQRSGEGLAATEGVVGPDVEICGRAIIDPSSEISFGPYSLAVIANHRPFVLPSSAKGDWMIYLRNRRTVLSRPELLKGVFPAGPQTSPLARAMELSPWDGLSQALQEVLVAASANDAEAERIVADLVQLVSSLDGLPPSSFEVLRMLPDHPAILARMAIEALPDQRGAVLALSDALPFAWCLLPKTCWDEAGSRRLGKLIDALSKVEGGVGLAIQATAQTAQAICEREPLLAPVLIGAASVPSRRNIAQDFVRKVVERADRNGTTSRYRDLGLAMPTDHLALPGKTLEWLDTPFAAALAAMGAWSPAIDDIRHIKTVARNFPTFFADAFAASLKELM
ncbi:STY4851/ECs_5259 family protein [Sphingomonas sp. LY160]|uniref:STY4851/ECs_5259 family protein n=1 Tax=Sphingomonas sp. LY160 TaxID=3095342 RepID=UPI002ADEA73D|nr:STY4851/ECs_5259 family protein [Sphingomonas sp. LY160]MEA1071765.1 STY4851/ECs_5259 family protein [Sphingomonas sp. LY160]